MLKTRLFLVLAIIVTAFSGCEKDSYNAEEQMATDEALIADYITKNNIVAMRHSTGVYYQIISPGSGSVSYSASTVVTANYTGLLLDGTVFDTSSGTPRSFALGQVIAGWQIGIPLIQKGGKIRLIIPSVLAYGNASQGSVPRNAVLDFEIELTDVK